jgi:hypothetical protein
MVTVGSALECVAIVAVVALLVAVGLMVYRRKRQKPVMQIP